METAIELTDRSEDFDVVRKALADRGFADVILTKRNSDGVTVGWEAPNRVTQT